MTDHILNRPAPPPPPPAQQLTPDQIRAEQHLKAKRTVEAVARAIERGRR